MEMEIVEVPLKELKPYSNNPRVITEEAILHVAASIREYGWRQPLVVDKEGVVVVGHTRLEAAKVLGLDVVPVHYVENLSPEEVRAYRVADNRTGEFTDWEEDKLSLEMQELMEQDTPLEALGFDDAAVEQMLSATTGSTSEAFSPSLEPSSKAPASMTQDKVDKAQQELESGVTDSGEPKLVDITCPSCGEEFFIDPKVLAE